MPRFSADDELPPRVALVREVDSRDEGLARLVVRPGNLLRRRNARESARPQRHRAHEDGALVEQRGLARERQPQSEIAAIAVDAKLAAIAAQRRRAVDARALARPIGGDLAVGPEDRAAE